MRLYILNMNINSKGEIKMLTKMKNAWAVITGKAEIAENTTLLSDVIENLDEYLEYIGDFDSLVTDTDSYKASHFLQYPAGTEYVSSYIESRGGKFNDAVFFGLQAYIKEYLSKPITKAQIDAAELMFQEHGIPFNREGWDYILKEYKGYLPVEIKALEEGTVVPVKNAMVQIRNTDPKCPWLTSYLETALLRAVWYPTTVATQSREIKKTIAYYLDKTADTMEKLPFMLHDFGARGASSKETAKLGGMAHLVNFQGTDTLTGIFGAMKYYACKMAGFSIPAAEHSTMTSWGKDNEARAYKNMLKQFDAPGALVAVVSDSYDYFNAIENIWGDQLKEDVLAMEGSLVIRPDSGDPLEIIEKTLPILEEKFGARVNGKGYKVLNDKVRLIQGDGVDQEKIGQILEMMERNGYSAENIAFGMGGALLQRIDRDTMKFAMKASARQEDGIWYDVFKDPKTDPGKQSKRGVLSVVYNEFTGFETVRRDNLQGRKDYLRTVFYNKARPEAVTKFDDVRARANVRVEEYKPYQKLKAA